jgi:hypothetical protein
LHVLVKCFNIVLYIYSPKPKNMKQIIENWLKENTVVIRTHDGSFRICLPYQFDFETTETAKGEDYDKAVSETAALLAAHIENAKGAH